MERHEKRKSGTNILVTIEQMLHEQFTAGNFHVKRIRRKISFQLNRFPGQLFGGEKLHYQKNPF